MVEASDFGRALRRERERVGLTQTQLAARAGMQPGDVSELEHGRDPRLTTLVRLARGLDVTAGELVGRLAR